MLNVAALPTLGTNVSREGSESDCSKKEKSVSTECLQETRCVTINAHTSPSMFSSGCELYKSEVES